MWSKFISGGMKFLQKAAPKVMAWGEKLLPKVTAMGEKVMGKLPGVVTKAQEGVAKTWTKVGSKLAAPTTKASIEGVGKGIAKGFGKVGSWMASHPLGTAKLAGAGFVGLEANKFLTNTTGKGLVENVGDAAKAIDNVASGNPAQAGNQTNQAGLAGIVGGIMGTLSNVFGTVSNVVGGLVGNKDMGGVLTALGVGAAGLFGLKRVGILAPLAIAGAGLFAANQAGLFKGAQQGSPIASQTNADLSKIAFASYSGTGAQNGTYQASTGVSVPQGNQASIMSGVIKPISISSLTQGTQNEHMSRAQAEAGLTDVERARLATARDTIARAELLRMGTSKNIGALNKTPEQIAADAAKRELKAWEMAGLDGKMPLSYSVELKVMSGELAGKPDPLSVARGGVTSRSQNPLFGSDNPAAMSASGKSSLDVAQMLSGAGLASGAVAGAASLEATSDKSEPSVTVEAEADDVSTQKPDLGPEQLA